MRTLEKKYYVLAGKQIRTRKDWTIHKTARNKEINLQPYWSVFDWEKDFNNTNFFKD